jgi:hypothetical protein
LYVIEIFDHRNLSLSFRPFHGRVWADFVRGLLRADAAHMVRLNRSSRRFCELMEAEVALISLLFSPRCAQRSNSGLIVTASELATIHRDVIMALAAQHRLPAVYSDPYFVTAGG